MNYLQFIVDITVIIFNKTSHYLMLTLLIETMEMKEGAVISCCIPLLWFVDILICCTWLLYLPIGVFVSNSMAGLIQCKYMKCLGEAEPQ